MIDNRVKIDNSDLTAKEVLEMTEGEVKAHEEQRRENIQKGQR